MLCVAQAPDGYVYVVDPQPVSTTECGLVLVSAQEAVSPFVLTAEQGAQISGAILLVWAAAFGFRMLIRQLSNRSEAEE